ncbi:protein shisa-like-1a [Elephas maximus indicus]|uniref:protein shisa-like-1a n=1 Tax=Elephas maximus indicus TaxID=99487 RepID=UPI0021164A89|nr:protein shisa-like-1a [Elephas maximus indicus]
MGFQRKLGPLLTGLSVGLPLLFSWVTLAQPTSLSALAHHPHLCQTTWDADGRHYPGFFCPRLSDTPEEAYCCHLQAAGASCCTQAEFEALYQVNVSTLRPPPILRGTGRLLALSLYSLLLLVLMTVDLVHFCLGRSPGRRGPRAFSSAARPLQVPAGTD